MKDTRPHVYVRCIDSKNLPITNGKIYRAKKNGTEWYDLKNDDGYMSSYHAPRFKEVRMMGEDKIKYLIEKTQKHLANLYAEADNIEETVQEAHEIGIEASDAIGAMQKVVEQLKALVPKPKIILTEKDFQDTDSMAMAKILV